MNDIAPPGADTYEVQRTLVISTAHISKHDAAMLEDNETWPTAQWVWAYGYLLWVSDDLEDFAALALELGFSPEIINLVRIARHQNCQWLRLDSDGPAHEWLPTFNWEAADDVAIEPDAPSHLAPEAISAACAV